MSCTIRAHKKLLGFDWRVDCSFGPEITILFGRSGAGKSITLQCLAGLVRPDAGFIQLGTRVFYDEQKNIHLPPQKRHVSFVFQNHALFPHMTVFENVLFGTKALAREERKPKVEEFLERLKLDLKRNHYPSQISGGEKQRVALARALIARPDMLLLDESFNSLDSITRYELQIFLKQLQAELKIPFVFVTHDIHEAFFLGQSMVILDQGKVIQRGQPQEILRAPENEMIARLLKAQPYIHS